MAAPQILVAEPSRRRESIHVRDSSAAGAIGWSFLGWVGLAFALVGFLDIALAFLPSAFGNAEWEFGTISVTLNGLPLPALGLAMVLAAGVVQGNRWKVNGAVVMLALLTLLLVGAAFLYITVVPVALRDVTNDAVRTGLLKSIVKALTLLVLYPTLFVCIAIAGWRAARAR